MLLIHVLSFISLAVASPLAHHDLHRRAPVAMPQTPSVAAVTTTKAAPSMWDNFTSGMSDMWTKAEHGMSDMATGFTTGLSTVATGMATMLGMGPMTHDHKDDTAAHAMTGMTPTYESPAAVYTMPSAAQPQIQQPPQQQDQGAWQSSGSGAGSGTSDSAQDSRRAQSISVVTANQKDTLCRRYPDAVISETRNAMLFTQPTALDIKCWTTPSIKNYVATESAERLNQARLSTTWLMTTTGCYVNENNIANKTVNFAQSVNYCAPPQHWVATMQPQYGRADCYQSTSLESPSMNLDNGLHIDIECFQDGEQVQNNPMWYRVMDHGCFMPAGVFDDKKFLGQAGGRCTARG